jgi:hypothetical protein
MIAPAHAKGQQITYGDRPGSGHRDVEWPVDALQDLAVGQFGQQPIHRLVQPHVHSSTRIIVAAAVIGLVSEAMRKIVSRRIGPSPLSAYCRSHRHAPRSPADQRDKGRAPRQLASDIPVPIH